MEKENSLSEHIHVITNVIDVNKVKEFIKDVLEIVVNTEDSIITKIDKIKKRAGPGLIKNEN